MRMLVGAATDVGLVRSHNEDSMLFSDRLVVVADGMGGHAAGDIASRLAVEHLGRLADVTELQPKDLHRAVLEANAAILRASRTQRGQAGMGTTLAGVGLVVVGGAVHWMAVNVGDSRVYRFADDALVQVTVDHSEVAELQAAGRLTASQARTHPARSVLTRSLGVEPAPAVDSWIFPATARDRFVICSDGLTNEVADPEIAEALRAHPDSQGAAEALVSKAVSGGGRDNVTVIVVALEVIPGNSGVASETSPRNRSSQGR